MRYLIILIGSGVLLLAGAIIHYQATGSIAFNALGVGTLGTNLIPLGVRREVRISTAAQVGSRFLRASDRHRNGISLRVHTKLAIYALARAFPGTDMLIWIGATMAAFPVLFAIIESDFRRVLAYGLNTQLGFMVVGVGIGTELSLNGGGACLYRRFIFSVALHVDGGRIVPD